MIGIGYYPNGGILGHLIGVPNDYKNMIKLFAFHWGYPFIYQTDDNKIVYLDKQRLTKNNNKYHTNFKLKWNEDEIGGFVLKSKKIIESIKPDGLIFIISSHGDRDRVIIDSDFEEYQLAYILVEYWNINSGCPYLADKPKIFFVDMCQGQKKPLPRGQKKKIKNAMATKGGHSKLAKTDKQDKQDKQAKPAEDKQQTDHPDEQKGQNADQTPKTHKQQTIAMKQTTDSKNDNNDDEHKKDKLEDNLSTVAQMEDKYLDYENFCVVYGNLDDYSVLDGGKEGGYLIRGLKSVLKQRDASNFELNQLIRMIGNETLRLVKGEKKKIKCKEKFQISKSPVRQIIECHSCILHYVFFGTLTQHQFTVDSQFRYNKYLDMQARQLKSSFKSFGNPTQKQSGINGYVITVPGGVCVTL